jgi:hypothetical protein
LTHDFLQRRDFSSSRHKAKMAAVSLDVTSKKRGSASLPHREDASHSDLAF